MGAEAIAGKAESATKTMVKQKEVNVRVITVFIEFMVYNLSIAVMEIRKVGHQLSIDLKSTLPIFLPRTAKRYNPSHVVVLGRSPGTRTCGLSAGARATPGGSAIEGSDR